MNVHLTPILTTAGIAAVNAALATDSTVKIKHFAIGNGTAIDSRDGAGTETAAAKAATALQNEMKRVPFDETLSAVSDNNIVLVANVRGADPAITVSEVGIFLEDGTLFGYTGSTTETLGVVSDTVGYNYQAAFELMAVPGEAIEIFFTNGTPDPGSVQALADALTNRNAAHVRRPIAVAPSATDAALCAGCLTASPYFSPDGFRHTASQFVVYTTGIDTDPENPDDHIVFDSEVINAVSEYEIAGGVLALLTDYRWRVRYQGTLGSVNQWSEWSELVSFTTPNTFVDAPAITAPADAAVDLGPSLAITADAFSVSNGTDTHSTTEWQASTAADFSNIIWTSSSAMDLLAVTIPEGILAENTTYYLRVRYVGLDFGTSAWSTVISFTTDADYVFSNIPMILNPMNNETDHELSVTVETSDFSVDGGTDTHTHSQYQMIVGGGDWNTPLEDSEEVTELTSYTFDTVLDHEQVYYVRARHRGATLGLTDWSTPVMFTTRALQAINRSLGSGEWIAPVTGTYFVTVRGGGGGGGAGGGGTGSSNPRSGSGGNGGTSRFGQYLSAQGGGGGQGGGDSGDSIPGTSGSGGGFGGDGGTGWDETGGKGGTGFSSSGQIDLVAGTVVSISVGGGGFGGFPYISATDDRTNANQRGTSGGNGSVRVLYNG